MVNKATLVGYLGDDPQQKEVNGAMMTVFSLATSEKYKSKAGKWVDNTEWHNIALFGAVAENAYKYLTKGSSVYVEGRISYNKWTDKNGNRRDSINIIVSKIVFLNIKGRGEAQGGQESPPPTGQDEQDLPF